MQKLEITWTDDYFLSNVKFTKAGLAKFEDWFLNHKAEYWNVDFDEIVKDCAGDAVGGECEPFCVLDNPYSYDNKPHRIDFVKDVDYVLEFESFESYRLKRLAYELNRLHNVMQSEMQRLGW
jgi:hypothetical protein